MYYLQLQVVVFLINGIIPANTQFRLHNEVDALKQMLGDLTNGIKQLNQRMENLESQTRKNEEAATESKKILNSLGNYLNETVVTIHNSLGSLLFANETNDHMPKQMKTKYLFNKLANKIKTLENLSQVSALVDASEINYFEMNSLTSFKNITTSTNKNLTPLYNLTYIREHDLESSRIQTFIVHSNGGITNSTVPFAPIDFWIRLREPNSYHFGKAIFPRISTIGRSITLQYNAKLIMGTADYNNSDCTYMTVDIFSCPESRNHEDIQSISLTTECAKAFVTYMDSTIIHMESFISSEIESSSPLKEIIFQWKSTDSSKLHIDGQAMNVSNEVVGSGNRIMNSICTLELGVDTKEYGLELGSMKLQIK